MSKNFNLMRDCKLIRGHPIMPENIRKISPSMIDYFQFNPSAPWLLDPGNIGNVDPCMIMDKITYWFKPNY